MMYVRLCGWSTLTYSCVGTDKKITLKIRLSFPSSAEHVLFVLLGWFSRWVLGGCTAVVYINPDITVRIGAKANVYTILNQTYYNKKIRKYSQRQNKILKAYKNTTG